MKNILVPTDGSQRAEDAAQFAIELAKKMKASLIFLNVIDDIAPAFAYEAETGASLDVVELDEQREKFAQESVNRLRENAEKAGVKSTAIVERGHPWEEILKIAEKKSVDHIVMGSHGRRALAAAVLGNVTFNVIHGAKIPVTVIPKG